jgi:hypothetical protein
MGNWMDIETIRQGEYPTQITKYWNFLYLNYDTLNCCENRLKEI